MSLSAHIKDSIVPPDNTEYWYKRFDAGAYDCPVSAGEDYVIWVKGMETQSSAVKDFGPCVGTTTYSGVRPASEMFIMRN